MSTGSLLADRFRAIVAKSKDPRMAAEEEFSVGYPTGFLSFDFTNGTTIHVNSEDKHFCYYSIGITDGSFVMVIGRSGSGKSTWMVQSAANIIRPYENSCMFIDNIEGGMITSRRETLTKFYGDELHRRCIVRNTGITIENFYERIRMIHDMKQENRTEFSYDTGMYDNRGNRIFKLTPTVYCLDSLALIMSDTYANEDELSGQMAATSTAKSNSAVFKRIIPMLKSANIILFCINHITEDVVINPMQRKKAQVSYLKPGERLPGGNAVIYLANNIIRVDDVTKLKASDGLGIDGSMVEFTLVKSRTNKAGQSCTLVFNQDYGFDEDLSLFVLLKQAGMINGAGAYFYIGDRSDHKFSQKTLKTKLKESPEFRDIFTTAALQVLQAKLSVQEAEGIRLDTEYDLNADIMSKLTVA